MPRPSPAVQPSPAVPRGAAACLRGLWRDARAVSTIEYGLILAFIVLAMFGTLSQLAGVTTAMWNDISSKVTTAR